MIQFQIRFYHWCINNVLFQLKSSPFPRFQQSLSLPVGQVLHWFPYPVFFLVETSCHSDTWAVDTASSPCASRNKLIVSVAVFFSVTRNLVLTCCWHFITHISGKLKKPHRNYYSTLRQRNGEWFGWRMGRFQRRLVEYIFTLVINAQYQELRAQSPYLIGTSHICHIHTGLYWSVLIKIDVVLFEIHIVH